jgi:hypothetical protein
MQSIGPSHLSVEIQNATRHAQILNQKSSSVGHTRRKCTRFDPIITPSALPCPSSSAAYHPYLVQRFRLALLPRLFPRRQRTDPSLVFSTRAICPTESCFLRSDLVAPAQVVASLAAFVCLCVGYGGRAGRRARQDPRTRRPRLRIRTRSGGFVWDE